MLPFPPSVNALYSTNWKTKRRFPSKRYEAWKAEAVATLYLIKMPRPRIAEQCAVTYNLGRPDKRVRDAGNYQKGLDDLLKLYGIVADDRYLYPVLIDWTDDHPGHVEVIIRPLGKPP